MDAANVHELINAIVPIISVRIVDANDKSTWTVEYVDEPTPDVLSQVQTVIDNYNIPTPQQIADDIQARMFLTSTNAKVSCYQEQQALGVPCDMTEADYLQLLTERQSARQQLL